MNNEGLISSLPVFHLSFHDLIKPRNFTCGAAVFLLCCPRIYQIHRGICQNLQRKTVGPTHYTYHIARQGILKRL